MDEGDVHPEKGLPNETQGLRLLGKKEDQGSDRRSIRVVSQKEKAEAKTPVANRSPLLRTRRRDATVREGIFYH